MLFHFSLRRTIAIAFIALALPFITHAATFSFVLDKQTFATGDEFVATVAIDSESVGINAAQGTVSFAPDVLSVTKIDRADSVFNFWIQEPTFSNTAGKITFLGGSTSGFTGSSLKVFKVTFKVKGIGKSDITLTDGAITASDGSGTNVLTATKGVNITSVSKGEIVTIPPPITRPATVAQKLPVIPALSLALYPDPTHWYNRSVPFTAHWVLPSDVSDVATSITKDPRSTPPKSEGLFDNKTFPALDDGVWYLHIQFKNNIGWGPINHYRIALDTVPPLPFKITADPSFSTDNPTPTFSYESADQLSNIASYVIRVDNKKGIITTSSLYTIPPQAPGKHRIRISAEDNASNITENIAELEILPIASPLITSISKSAYVNEGELSATGTSIPNATIEATLRDGNKATIAVTSADTGADGNWTIVIDKPLKKDTYTLSIIAKDKRGAQSLPTISGAIPVRERPLVTLGGIEITQSLFFILITLVLVLGFVGGWLYEREAKLQRRRKVIVAQRDVVNAFAMIQKDVEKALTDYDDHKITEEESEEIVFLLKRMSATVSKVEKYVSENIAEID
jgi:hypothetical protein